MSGVLNCLMFLMNSFLVITIVAFYTVLESKVLAGMQSSVGPNYYQPFFSVFQGFFDGLKLLESTIILNSGGKVLYLISPVILFSVNLVLWTILPIWDKAMIDFDFNMLCMFMLISLLPVWILFSGLSSKNTYALLGVQRGVSLFLSYELVFSSVIVTLCFMVESLNIMDFCFFQKNVSLLIFMAPHLFLMAFLCSLMETNSAPFDLAESESELVAGFHVEYSGFLFALCFLSEYSTMMFSSNFLVLLFTHVFYEKMLLDLFYILKVMLIMVSFMIMSAILPSVSMDQMLKFGWKKLLPLVLNNFLLSLLLS